MRLQTRHCRTSEFLKTEGIFIYLLNREKDSITCTYSWTEGQDSIVKRRSEIDLNHYPYLKSVFSTTSVLEIFDMDDLPSDEYNDIVQILGEKVKSLLVLPIENNDNVYGYLVLQSVKENKAWGTIDKNNLMIITNMIAGTIERIQQERQINYMAYYDMLTGIPNRTLFRDRLNQSVMLAERRSEIIAVIFWIWIPLRMSTIQLVMRGDQLINKSPQTISIMRKSDTVSRFGWR